MRQYILRRLLQGIPVIIGVALLTDLLVFAAGDPARLLVGVRGDQATVEALRHEMGLDLPWYQRFPRFLGHLARGDLGRSYATREPVVRAIAEALPATVILSVAAMSFAIVGGLALGVLAGLTLGRTTDQLAMLVAVLGVSVPTFVLGLALAWCFGLLLEWFPLGGYIDEQGVSALVLPAITLGMGPLAIISRLVRANILEVLPKTFVVCARAKGLTELAVIVRHALRNALLPVITVIGGSLSALLSGAFFTEYVFSWPGLGLLAVDSITRLDLPMIQGTVLLAALTFILMNILVDILYAWADPRIELG